MNKYIDNEMTMKLQKKKFQKTFFFFAETLDSTIKMYIFATP